MKNDKQPEIRLPGFTEDWEQRKFGEIINERREKTKIENEDILLSSAIDGMYLNSELFSHFRGISNIGYLKIRKNDMILSAQNLHLGNCNINKRFDHGIISPAYKVYSLVDVDVDFIHAWIKKDSTKKFFEKATTEGASVCRKNIEWGTLYNQKMYIPIYSEQQKIGVFFKQMDDTITLHQQELETLKQTKQGFLQKMLPKEGESLPEIRFLGFTENWKQRELGSISNKIGSGKTPRGGSSVYTQLGIPFLRSQNIYGDRVNFSELVYITETVDKEMANSRVQKNDILLNITGASIGRSAVYESSNAANVNQHVCIIRPTPEIDSNFLQLNITSTKGQKQIEINQAGGGREGLNFQQISKMKFSCPVNKDEQIQIGNFFKQLDRVITLQQQELDALKQTKKAFLQKMFV